MTASQKARATPLAAIPGVTRTDLRWLIAGEREYPFEMPDVRELTPWYLFSLAAIAAAGVLALMTGAISRLCGAQSPSHAAEVVFWVCILVLGIVTTPLANRWQSQFVFTWPLTLVAIHQIALTAVSRSKQSPRGKMAALHSFAAVALLVVTCLIYFKLTRQLSLAPAWYFLAVFPAAWPIAIPAARRLRGGVTSEICWMIAIFSIYFWAAGGVMMLRTECL